MEDERLPIRKIVVDSRERTAGTPSEFQIGLPEAITLPRHFGCYVTDIQCQHSFRTVHGAASVGMRNHYFYFFERLVSAFLPNENDFTVLNRAVLSPGSYTPTELCAELATQMNAVSFFGSSAYTVSFSNTLHCATITLNYAGHGTHGSYHGFIPVSAKALANTALQTYAQAHRLTNNNGQAYPTSHQGSFALSAMNPESADGLFGVDAHVDAGFRAVELLATLNNTDLTTQFPKTFVSQTVDVRNVHTLYLHSNSLSNFSAIGPAGSRSVLAHLAVTSLSGGVIQKSHSGNLHDIQDCSGKMLSVLDFSCRNSKNEIVDLHGGAISFTIIFAPLPNT